MTYMPLELPVGVQDYLPLECELKRETESKLRKSFNMNGFREVETPAFEYYNIFSGGIGAYKEQHMIKFFDRNGRILALRPDITVPIARMVATWDEKEPRLFYIQNAYQMSDGNIRQKSEHTQAGVEMFGRRGSGADAEIIALAIKSLLAVGLKDFKIEIGQSGFFKGLINGSGLSDEIVEEIKNHIDFKNTVELDYVLSIAEVGDELRQKLMILPELFGGEEALKRAAAISSGDICAEALQNLQEVYEILCDMGFGQYVSIDLGMLHDINYYSGVIFRGLISEIGFPVLSGGRYDGLAAEFGKERPAIGFALDLKRAMTALERQGGLAPAKRSLTVVLADKENAWKGAELAESLREGGRTVIFEIADSYRGDEAPDEIYEVKGGGEAAVKRGSK